ncbi:hypothetical protein IQ231_16535 [Cuspidothrix issatschenkoi LEGE 03284]|nr:hypothetical protein [Cuspidothrix issatschenkoi]MBE9233233.1 hypothetical protein [Cuspidothrix issatschenkoi LEGE 03284]
MLKNTKATKVKIGKVIKSLFATKCYDTDYQITKYFWRFGTKIASI